MPKLLKTGLWLICVLATCGFASCGRRSAPPTTWPTLPPPPATLMNSPNYEQRLRDELFESEPKPTPKCADCKK